MARLDLDLDLKLRFKRLFWTMGYWCSLEVPVSHYEFRQGKRRRVDLTDIDVLGVRFDPALQAHRVMADCKSGMESHNRIFWLRGAMQYFEVDSAYFVKTRISQRERAIASRLGIATLDPAALDRLETRYSTESVGLPLADPAVYAEQLALLSRAGCDSSSKEPQAIGEARQFCRYMYWYIPRERRILNLLEIGRRISPFLRGADLADRYLVYHISVLASIALLDMAGAAAARDITDVPGQIRHYLFGGPMALAEREKFLMLLNKATGLTERLEPDYFDSLVELTNRMVSFPQQCLDVPRYIEALSFVYALPTASTLTGIFQDRYSTETLKLAKDVLYFVAKVGNMNPLLLADLNNA